jgi:hypothetical protein
LNLIRTRATLARFSTAYESLTFTHAGQNSNEDRLKPVLLKPINLRDNIFGRFNTRILRLGLSLPAPAGIFQNR